MPIDKEEIKKALDSFENDDFVDAKDILAKEIRRAKEGFIKDKCELKNDITPEVEPKDDKKSEEE